jgi:RNA polymerase sigma-70 factor (ECF subfamily)
MDVASVTPDLAQADQRRVTTLGRQVRAALAGDEAAFEAIVEARLPRTYRIALAILGSEADARDAMQEAWIAAWRHLPSLLDASRFDAWLDQIVVNACRAAIRKRGRVREIALVDDFDVAAPHAGPDQVSEREALDRAFSRLTVEQRAILVLHHLERRPMSAIAAALSVPIGTAKSRLHAARSTLQRNLEAER